MNAVIGLAGLLGETNLTSEQRDYVDTIRYSGETLLTIVNDILDFSKIESGKLEVEMMLFDLRECIEHTFDLLSEKAAEKDLDLYYTVGEGTPAEIISDPIRVRQILVNLVSNALKFTQKGEVEVSLEAEQLQDGRYEVHFCVRDTGIGIAPERMDRLFQAFSQIDSSISRNYGGTGLGLAISKKLTELLGGRIWVESKQNVGSQFHFSFSCEAVDKPLPLYLQVNEEFKGRRVLLIAEYESSRKILTQSLTRWGMEVLSMNSLPEAVDRTSFGEKFDLAILDIASTVEWPLLTLLKQAGTEQDMPIFFYCSTYLKSDKDPLITAYLAKPIKPLQLFDRLHYVFDAPHSGSTVEEVLDKDASTTLLNIRILVAEDNVVNQKVVLQILRSLGYRADVAANGREVLEMLRKVRYDVVLMDIQMPEMDGFEATQRIRQGEHGNYQPYIIAVTANAMKGDCERCLEAGMEDYVSKPVKKDALHQALKRMVKSRMDFVDNDPITEVHNVTEGTIDLSSLISLRELQEPNEPDVVLEVINSYLEHSQVTMEALTLAIEQRKSSDLEFYAHSLKSSSSIFEAKLLMPLCAELEKKGQQGLWDGVPEVFEQVQSQYAAVVQALKDFKKTQ